MNWIISANSKVYDHASSFEHFGNVDWRQGNTKYQVGDIVFIYCTRPLKKIRYKCIVKKIDMSFNEIRDDKEYWLDTTEYENSIKGKFFRLELINEIDSNLLSLEVLQKNGLSSAPQGPIKATEELLSYLKKNFIKSENDDYFPEIINSNIDVYEGIKKQITVNKYERSSLARAKCVEFHGYKCQICNFDFEKTYGEHGKEFIHVHHINPIHTIGTEYKIDYEKDLIPVCPNCHAMLHRKAGKKELTINELKRILNNV